MKKMPVEFIHSFAVRNFRKLTGLHTFRFEEGINTITGGNASGKSSFIDAIEFVFNPKNDHKWWHGWELGLEERPTLLEITFTAGGKYHYLRRVVDGGTTTDLHLYVGKKNPEFFRDGDASEYLNQIVSPTHSNVTKIFKTRFTWINATQQYDHFVPRIVSDKTEEIDNRINSLLKDADCDLKEIFTKDGKSYAKFVDDSIIDFEKLSIKEKVLIDSMSNLLSAIIELGENNDSKVLIFDDLERIIGRKFKTLFIDLLQQISNEHSCQIILTSRYHVDKTNRLKLSTDRISRMYNMINANPPYYTRMYNKVFKNLKKFSKKHGGSIDWKK